MRKKEYSSFKSNRLGDNSRSVKWSKGVRTVSTSRVKADKNGELFTVSSQRSFNFGGLLKAVAFVLLLAAVFAVLTGSSEKSFYSFLTMLQDIPEVFPIDNMINYFRLQDFSNLPGWLEFLAEIGTGFLSLLGFVIKGIVSSVTLIFYFLRWLFV